MQNIPVLFLTAKSDVEDEHFGLELGAVDYIRKPFHAESVLARVRNHFAIKRQLDSFASDHSEQDYQFRQQGQGWVIRYAGGATYYLPHYLCSRYSDVANLNNIIPFFSTSSLSHYTLTIEV